MKQPSSKGGRRASLVLIFSALLLIVSFFGLYNLYVEDHSYESPEVGGTYAEGLTGTILGVNPLLSQRSDAEEDVVSLVFSGLTKYDPRQKKIVPDLATFEGNSNNTEFIFRLREDATWHDGQPVTIDDVLFTYNLLSQEDFPNNLLKARFTNVLIEKTGDLEVKFTLPNSYAFFPTTTTIGLLPKHLWENVAMEDFTTHELNQQPIGSGPYSLEDTVSSTASENGQVLTLAKYEDYYGDSYYLEKVSLHIVPDFSTVIAKKNSLLGMKEIPYEHVETVQDMERFELVEAFLPKYFAAFLNVESDALSEKKVRQALSLAVNRETLLSDLDYLRPITSPFLQRDTESWTIQYFPDRAAGGLFDAGWKKPSPELLEQEKKRLIKEYNTGTGVTLEEVVEAEEAATDESAEVAGGENPSEPEPTTETTFTERGIVTAEVATETTEEPDKDLTVLPEGVSFENITIGGQRAVDLMEEFENYRYNDEGMPLELRLVTLDSPSYLRDMAFKIADNWKEVGVKLDVQAVSPADISVVIHNRDYDVLLIGQELGYDQDVFAYWHSSSAKRSGLNVSNFKNSRVDELLEALRNPKGADEDAEQEYKLKNIGAISEIFKEEMPAIFLFQQKGYFAVDEELSNVYIKNIIKSKDRFAYLNEWYLNTGKHLKQEFTFTNFVNWVIKSLSS